MLMQSCKWKSGVAYIRPFLDLHVLNYMPQLTRLDLSHNALPCLPPALSTLTSLQELDVRCNLGLKLSDRCVGILEALPCLRHVMVDDLVYLLCALRMARSGS